MKLLFDENLSPRLVELLAESAHVHLGLGSASDGQIWERAKAQGFAIVSKDSDFANRSVAKARRPR